MPGFQIDHLVLTIVDLDRTCRFYQQALYLEVLQQEGRTALLLDGQKINLHQAGREIEPHAARPTPGSADLCLVARESLREVQSRLQVLGVETFGPVKRAGARGKMDSLYFRDPDGNLLEVSNYAESSERGVDKGIFRNSRQLVLASASPRRSDLLLSAGLTFTVQSASAAEPEPETGESAEAYAMRSARAKGLAVVSQTPANADILAADTVVVLVKGKDEVILGKPRDAEEALDMLCSLRGRWHRVVTGVCLLPPAGKGEKTRTEKCFAVTSDVYIGDWDDKVLRSYVETGEPMGKAGAYAIQGQGAALVREVRGSYTNVVGLPLAEVLEVLVE